MPTFIYKRGEKKEKFSPLFYFWREVLRGNLSSY
nr:MAG TPA: hypothetical protein [Caudoviricetes sp.]